jgi:tetratricopeptide (TPR) repeat protein
MDLLDFKGEGMYFDRPLAAEAAGLIARAARHYGEGLAEHCLLRAYFLEPGHLTVLVALYRYYYYRHAYGDALRVADRAIAAAAGQLDLPEDWRLLSQAHLGHAVMASMSLTRFLLLALKGSGYLYLRLGDAAAALERLQKVVELDTSDRLGSAALLAMARARAAQGRAVAAGPNVTYLNT